MFGDEGSSGSVSQPEATFEGASGPTEGAEAGLFPLRAFGSSERIASSSNMQEGLNGLLSSSAELGERLKSANGFWQNCVASHPGDTRIVATYHPDLTLEEVNTLTDELRRITGVIGQFSRVQFTTPDNVSPLVAGSRSERIEFTVRAITPMSPQRKSKGRVPGSPGAIAQYFTTAEIGSANSTPT